MNESDIFNKRVESIQQLLNDTYKNLDKIRALLDNVGKELKSDVYRGMEGVVGTFDGSHLVDSSGNKYDVPSNYSAKSRLVFGDTIKMVEDEGKTVFKQIQKVERKKTDGVLSKKEGKWYILTDSGSYRISDIAAEFNDAALNDEAIAFIPAQNLNAPYATLDTVLKKAPAGQLPSKDKPAYKPRPAAPKTVEVKEKPPVVHIAPEAPKLPKVIKEAPVEPQPMPEPEKPPTASVAPADEDDLR